VISQKFSRTLKQQKLTRLRTDWRELTQLDFFYNKNVIITVKYLEKDSEIAMED